MTPDAGKPSLGGPAENKGTKGYATDDLPLRDGHVQEPDLPRAGHLVDADDVTDDVSRGGGPTA